MDALGVGTECMHCHEWVKPEFTGSVLVKVSAEFSAGALVWRNMFIGDPVAEYICPICRNRIHIA